MTFSLYAVIYNPHQKDKNDHRMTPAEKILKQLLTSNNQSPILLMPNSNGETLPKEGQEMYNTQLESTVALEKDNQITFKIATKEKEEVKKEAIYEGFDDMSAYILHLLRTNRREITWTKLKRD